MGGSEPPMRIHARMVGQAESSGCRHGRVVASSTSSTGWTCDAAETASEAL